MKKLLLSAAALAACTLMSCGGGYEKNDVLGTFPGIYVKAHEQREALTEKLRNESISREKYLKKEEQINEESLKAAEKALESLIGKEIPFDMGYEDPYFEIESLTVSGGTPSTGALQLCAVVKAKRDVTCTPEREIGILLVDSDQSGTRYPLKLNPFVHTPGFNIPYGTTVAAGEYCTEDGSLLYLYCGSYDFTDFDHIVFVPREVVQ